MANVASLIGYDAKNPKGAGSSLNEKLFMWGLLNQSKFKCVLEIGVSRGHMTLWLAFAQSAHGGKLTRLDNWSKMHGGEATSPSYALKRLKDNKLNGVVDFVSSDSYTYLCDKADDSFDLVHVDGDHGFEGAYKDIKEAIRVAKCMVTVHDTNQGYVGPRDACLAIEKEYGVQGTFIEGPRGFWICNL